MNVPNASEAFNKPADYDQNEEGIPKSHLKELIRLYNMEPGINTALFIAAGALGRKKTWTGTDYSEHYIRVSGLGIRHHGLTDEEIITGILHDVVEDSDWEIDDLRDVGFSELICNAVESVTKKPPSPNGDKEKYLDATKRASINPIGLKVKKRDNDDNMDLTRGAFAAGDKQKFLYHVSFTYLDAVENKHIAPNSSIWHFLRDPRYSNLINHENAAIIQRETSDVPPQEFITKYNLKVAGNNPSPAP